MVQGPMNTPRDAIAPLAGVIETDWSPYTFTMNWKFTAAGRPARFEKGDPFCCLYPVRRQQLQEMQPEIRSLSEDPDLAQRYNEWTQGRQRFNAELSQPGSSAQEEKWQKN